MEISEDLRCVFSAEIEEQDGSYVVEVPERELELDSLDAEAVYRVAVLNRHGSTEGSTDDRKRGGSDGSLTSTGASTDGASDTSASSRTDTGSVGAAASDGTTAGGAAADEPEPPVDRGDEITVDIEGIGDQGDGIARVDRGYVIIVPDTEKGERVRIRVTSVKQNVAFAEVIERVERHQYE
ncbi:TRAM domain-containing protein [Halobaculum sp. EA56]|uniref:TRAM domain-containing protein n=1 Tax=Halobaculum sp. EA56 TaxID=3421648 RepID=UPI003EBF8CC0